MTADERDLIARIEANTRQIEALTETVRDSAPRPIPLSRHERDALLRLAYLVRRGFIRPVATQPDRGLLR